ncbi:MAG: Type II secretion system protein D precursor [Lentisphaerae bacterium ADurb.BinA184]|nr:MAG: Type II secretion system protein D precursor [Lentisphaerae bacterium ADurb.BinA184]
MAASFAYEQEEETEIRYYTCRHVRSETVRKVLESFLTPSGTVADSAEADIVVIADIASNMDNLMRVAEGLDQPVAQILVEARVVEFTVDAAFEKEVNLEFMNFSNLAEVAPLPSGTTEFVARLTDAFVSPSSSPLNTRGSLSWLYYDPDNQNLLSLFIRFLESQGKARILSAPNLILRRGTEGSIITGEEVPIQTQTVTSGSVSTSTQFKSVGIKLRVRPLMISGPRVRIAVSPEVSNVTRTDSSGAPIIAIRSADTELELDSGQLVSIGGLLRSEERETRRRVPVLGSLPVLGHLFRGVERESVQTHLVIFLRILVIEDGFANVPLVRDGQLPADVRPEVERIEQAIQRPERSPGQELRDVLRE